MHSGWVRGCGPRLISLPDTPTASAALPRGDQILLLPRPAAQSWSGGAAWPQVTPRGGCARSGDPQGLSPTPLGDLGAREQRQCCLEDRGWSNCWDVMLILFCWVSSGAADPLPCLSFPICKVSATLCSSERGFGKECQVVVPKMQMGSTWG